MYSKREMQCSFCRQETVMNVHSVLFCLRKELLNLSEKRTWYFEVTSKLLPSYTKGSRSFRKKHVLWWACYSLTLFCEPSFTKYSLVSWCLYLELKEGCLLLSWKRGFKGNPILKTALSWSIFDENESRVTKRLWEDSMNSSTVLSFLWQNSIKNQKQQQ